MSVGAMMTTRVVCVRPGLPIEQAHAIMVRRGIRHLPVVEGRKLLGVLSDRDLLIRAVLDPDGTLRYPDCVVADAMTPTPFTASMQDSVPALAARMMDQRVDCLPVVDAHGSLLGLITTVDLLGVLRAQPGATALPFRFTLHDSDEHELGE